MQESLKIQKQLQKLRQQCVKEYLETKLQTISSKQVIHDILIGFLESNNQEFLQNISKTIHEVKQANKQLKDSLQRLKKQQAPIMQIQIQKSLKSMKMIYEDNLKQVLSENDRLKQQIQAESIQFNKKIMEVLQEIEIITMQKNQIQNNLIDAIKNNKIFEMEMENFKCYLHNQNQEYQNQKSFYQQKIKAYQNSFNMMQNQKNQLTTQNSQNINKLTQHIHLLEQNQINKTKHYEYVLIKSQQIAFQFKSQNQKLKTKFNQQLIQKSSLISKINDLTSTNLNLIEKFKSQQIKNQKVQQELERSQSTVGHYQEENRYLLNQIQNINNKFKNQKNKYQNMQNDKKNHIFQIQQQKQKQIHSKIQQIQTLSSENTKLNQAIIKNDQLISDLSKKIEIMKEQLIELQINLQKNIQQNKSLINYNLIQHEQLQKSQKQIFNLTKQQQKHLLEITKNQIQINQMQLQIRQYKNLMANLQQNVLKLEQSLELQKQKQKYYNLYLQEIAFLKKQLQKYRPSKNQFYYEVAQCNQINKIYKKSKIYIQILNLKQQLHHLKTENINLKSFLKQFLSYINQQISKNIAYIINIVHSQSLKCLYCQHKQQNLKINIKNNATKLSFDKTIPKNNIQIGNYSSIKKNLKTIQQKFHHINQQNSQFTSYIDNILNKQ